MKTIESSQTFQHFVGVDVGKETLVAQHFATRQLIEFPNTSDGIANFLQGHAAWLKNGYFVVDTTGGWERPLIGDLIAAGVTVHRADGRRVKSFARSLGKMAKTDAIDASVLARYGHDRHAELFQCQLANESLFLLKNLVTRRGQLARYAKEERQRLSGPLPNKVRFLVEQNLDALCEQMTIIEQEISLCLENDTTLKRKAEILQTVPGVGPQTAAFLLAEMPELGQLNRKQIASIAGLAPHAYDSGKMSGRRTTYGGRRHVKAALFFAALNAARSKNNPLGDFYTRLVNAGKPKRCALIAVARKIITIINARLQNHHCIQPEFMSR
jgi:transposase